MSVNRIDFDVVIVGCGPTGATLANLLGICGVNVLILEKENKIYPLPRAVHFDDEVMRVFQTVGIAKELVKKTHVNPGMRFVDNQDNVLLNWPRPIVTGKHGWNPSYRFHQPDLEKLLRERVSQQKTVTMQSEQEVISVKENEGFISVIVRGLCQNKVRSINTKFVVGCDGARSIVRTLIGGEVEDLGFRERWLVADVLLKKEMPELGDFTIQYCDSERPMTYCRSPKNRRRWEIMLLDGEIDSEMMLPEKVWSFLGRWIGKNDADLERSAVYTFESMLSQRWRRGRMMIAGDSAHLMPPFMGQGMCAGIRDATNLAWKLSVALKIKEFDSILDTYQSERSSNVRTYIETAIRLGQLINTHDPKGALEISENKSGGLATMRSIYPILGTGVGSTLPANMIRHRGLIISQPKVIDSVYFDDKYGYNHIFISRVAVDINISKDTQVPFVFITTQNVSSLEELLNDLGANAVLIRPDRYIIGTANSAKEIELLSSFSYH